MRYSARVIPGRGEGHKLGFPTLNLEMPAGFSAKHGVYAGWVWLGGKNDAGTTGSDAGHMPAAIHYGPAPTFDIKTDSLEIHVINVNIPTTPESVSFEFIKYLREIKDFQNPEALIMQIRQDVLDSLKALED